MIPAIVGLPALPAFADVPEQIAMTPTPVLTDAHYTVTVTTTAGATCSAEILFPPNPAHTTPGGFRDTVAGASGVNVCSGRSNGHVGTRTLAVMCRKGGERGSTHMDFDVR